MGRHVVRLCLAAVVVTIVVSACGGGESGCRGPMTPLDVHACLRFGVSTPGGPTAVEEFEGVAKIVGEPPTVVLSYSDFTSPPPIAGLRAVRDLGAVPVITWEPWRWLDEGRYGSSEFSLSSIAAGVHDNYLYRWADELITWDALVYLRFAHEPNGTWYPWSVAQGTQPSSYIAAWRHIHDLFASKGADNVKWVWAPNVVFTGSSPMADLYPGNDYVDVLGVDGYNWGTTQPWSTWVEAAELFGPSLHELRNLAPRKPILVTEVGSAEAGGSKADWIGTLVDFLTAQDDVSGFIWFDHDKEADWRLTSTPESTAALADALGRKHR
nr:endoglucanase, family 26 [Rhodococcus sp. JVH1]